MENGLVVRFGCRSAAAFRNGRSYRVPGTPPAYSTVLGETAAPYRPCDGARMRSLGET